MNTMLLTRSVCMEKINAIKSGVFFNLSLMLTAGHGVTKKATPALPQLTVQHCAGCLVTEGWYRERDAKPSHPAHRAELPTPDSAGGSHVCSESCRKPPNSTWGKEIALGKKLVLQLGAAWLDTPQPFWKRNCSRHQGKAGSLSLPWKVKGYQRDRTV